MCSKSTPWLGALVLAFLSSGALAADGADTDAAEFGAPVSVQALDEQRGGEAHLELNLQETRATVQGNQAINSVTGSNFIKDDAFRDSGGLPIAIQNTGNNVSVQNAIIFNLDVR
jgi:hypothetical protein